MITKVRQQLFKERLPDGSIRFVGGMDPHIRDSRDFKYKDLGGWFDYKPKHDVLILPTLSVKDQMNLNTCVWNSLTVQREVTEQCVLSVESVVRLGFKNGAIRGNGFSSLREGQEIGRKFGICEEVLLPNDITDWYSYSHGSLNSQQLQNAQVHRSKSYFLCDSQSEVLKALDDNYIIQTGLDWRSSYNMSGGFSSPWVLKWGAGWYVGGHAVDIIGYNIPKQLLVFQNSFGTTWGDNGKFYVRFQDWFKSTPDGYATVDVDADAWTKFVSNYNGRDVKTKDSSAIYRIVDGKKRAYPDALTYFAYGGAFDPQLFEVVSGSLLDKVPQGAAMRVEDSPYWGQLVGSWPAIQRMSYPLNWNQIRTLIK